MYQTGELLRFSSFAFKNGKPPKPKFFIVLGQIDDKVLMASLPTSQDHIPADLEIECGCVDIPERDVNAFVFSPKDRVTPAFSFEKRTFVYGEQVDEYEQKRLDEMPTSVEHLGLITPQIFKDLKNCVKKAKSLRRKYRTLL